MAPAPGVLYSNCKYNELSGSHTVHQVWTLHLKSTSLATHGSVVGVKFPNLFYSIVFIMILMFSLLSIFGLPGDFQLIATYRIVNVLCGTLQKFPSGLPSYVWLQPGDLWSLNCNGFPMDLHPEFSFYEQHIRILIPTTDQQARVCVIYKRDWHCTGITPVLPD